MRRCRGHPGSTHALPPERRRAREHALLLLTKALQLIQSLDLNEREVRYLLTHAADLATWISSKLTHAAKATIASRSRRALFAQFLRLAGYARLKRDLADGTDDLIGIFEAKALDQVYPLIAKLTRRDEATVKATARPWRLAGLCRRAGRAAAVGGAASRRALRRARRPSWWTRDRQRGGHAGPALRHRPRPEGSDQGALRAETWQRVAQPIFDKLRQRQRDALVAHVMHQHGFARLEQLYEYFLIDPGMEPVVQTSRIRLAISSVQLFIQRCLLNLEQARCIPR